MYLPVSRNCKYFMVYSFLLWNEKGAVRGCSGGSEGKEGGLKLKGLAPYFKINLF